MPTIKTNDGAEIFYKDWSAKNGSGQPIVFHHGWPLSADDWDTQMLFFLKQGYRVIAHDRRGHGRSSQTAHGHDMDTYAADVAAVVAALDLRDVIHVGHSTGGGEATRYVAALRQRAYREVGADRRGAASHGQICDESGRYADRGVRWPAHGARGQPRSFYWDFTVPFYSYNREGAAVNEHVRHNWMRQAMMGGAHPQYECIKAFSETDFTEDLRSIDAPVVIIHGEDDQIVPIADSALLAAKLVKQGTLKVYPGLPHGMCTTHAERINPDLLGFIKA